jgi:hypothetical protein
MNVALSHPIGFFFSSSTRVYIRALQPDVREFPPDVREFPLDVRRFPLDVRRFPLDVKNYLERNTLEQVWGPSRRKILTPRRRNHYYKIPPDVLPP